MAHLGHDGAEKRIQLREPDFWAFAQTRSGWSRPLNDKIDQAETFVLTSSRDFPAWLARSRVSLAFTTYQAGKLFLIGLRDDGRLSIFERSFPRCMGLGVSSDGRTLVLSTQVQLIRFDNVAYGALSH
jgi:hypothetical protein